MCLAYSARLRQLIPHCAFTWNEGGKENAKGDNETLQWGEVMRDGARKQRGEVMDKEKELLGREGLGPRVTGAVLRERGVPSAPYLSQFN